jgi:hypothetical protein
VRGIVNQPLTKDCPLMQLTHGTGQYRAHMSAALT